MKRWLVLAVLVILGASVAYGRGPRWNQLDTTDMKRAAGIVRTWTFSGVTIDTDPDTIAIDSLGVSVGTAVIPADSTCPAFTLAPLVEILRIDGDRGMYVDAVNADSIWIDVSPAGSDDLPINITIKVISND